MNEMDPEPRPPWFKRRRWGYGVMPISDEGVIPSAVTFVALGLCIGLHTALIGKSLLSIIVSVISFSDTLLQSRSAKLSTRG